MGTWRTGHLPWKGGTPLSNGFTRESLLSFRGGYGAAATGGGLSGQEIVVTTLAEDKNAALNTTGNMSLRSALAVSGAKWITFAPGMTAPARSTWPVPYNNAPLSAWRSDAIWIQSGNQLVVPANTTVDGRGTTVAIQGKGIAVDGSNVIIHNMIIDYSQWWAANKAQGVAGLYNIWDADMNYSLGPQPIQRAGQAYASGTDNILLPGNWKGTWVSGRAYQAGLNYTTKTGTPPDGVVYNGIGYKCVLATSGTTPPPSDSAHWTPALGGSVNGAIYSLILQNSVGGVNVGYQNIWLDHNTLIGVAPGNGNPVMNSTLWDFNDGGFAAGYSHHNITYSWNHFQNMNKSSILGINATSSADAPDLVSLHHNRFEGGFQRQPLARYGRYHVYANWYDNPGLAGVFTECIACDNDTQMLYEGNLAESSISQSNPLAFKRGGTNTHVVGKTHNNAALGTVTLANDVGTLSFTPSYQYALPDLLNTQGQYLSAAAAQAAFRTIISNGSGAQ